MLGQGKLGTREKGAKIGAGHGILEEEYIPISFPEPAILGKEHEALG
jgi:hypothetical protein